MADQRVEEVARAIYNLHPAIQPWDGDPFEFDEPRAEYNRDLAYRQARAAVAALDGFT
jgi:hypothetical protein